MVYKKKMMVITDRACHSMKASFSVTYYMEGTEIKDTTIRRRINKAIKRSIEKHFNKQFGVPFLFVDEWKQELTEIVDEYSGNYTTVKADCDVSFIIEDPDNYPEKLGKNFISILVNTISQLGNKEFFKLEIENENNIAISDIEKGYIQLDYSVFFPQQ